MKAVFCITLAITGFTLHAQEDDLRQILRKTFYDMRVHDKIFFEYKGKEGITFLEGYKSGMKGAFMLPDTNVQRQYPNILEAIGTSHGTEKYFMTITLLSHPSGNVYVSSHIMDPAIQIWVNFDRIFIADRTAVVIFHTTSWSEIASMKDKYVQVECDLRKKRAGWKIVKLEMNPRPCCSSLW